LQIKNFLFYNPLSPRNNPALGIFYVIYKLGTKYIMNQMIEYCQKKNSSCAQSTIKYNLLQTGGNNPQVSSKMKYAEYAKNFSKSKPSNPDICKNGETLTSPILNSNIRYRKFPCNNSIFTNNWREKTGLQKCGCTPGSTIF
jgi:hypothetical protein